MGSLARSFSDSAAYVVTARCISRDSDLELGIYLRIGRWVYTVFPHWVYIILSIYLRIGPGIGYIRYFRTEYCYTSYGWVYTSALGTYLYIGHLWFTEQKQNILYHKQIISVKSTGKVPKATICYWPHEDIEEEGEDDILQLFTDYITGDVIFVDFPDLRNAFFIEWYKILFARTWCVYILTVFVYRYYEQPAHLAWYYV